MSIFTRRKRPTKLEDDSQSITDILGIPTPEEVGKKFEETVQENAVKDTADHENGAETANRTFNVKVKGKTYKVLAIDEKDAVIKVKKLLNIPIKDEVEELKKPANITISDIFNAIAEEIRRIVTVAHPESIGQSYDRYIAVLTEELGEIVHEINDEYEGKRPSKNTFVECVQLCAATTMLAKKFADEHPEIFDIEE